MKSESDATAPGRGYRFKTFSGVFLPSILTILGVVMFMRLGTIVGELGVFGAFGRGVQTRKKIFGMGAMTTARIARWAFIISG